MLTSYHMTLPTKPQSHHSKIKIKIASMRKVLHALLPLMVKQNKKHLVQFVVVISLLLFTRGHDSSPPPWSYPRTLRLQGQ
jgi:hypothetical protein